MITLHQAHFFPMPLMDASPPLECALDKQRVPIIRDLELQRLLFHHSVDPEGQDLGENAL